MSATTLKNNVSTTGSISSIWNLIIAQYLSYCDEQDEMNVYWYMKAIIIIPCVFMVPSIFVMALSTDYYVYYVAFTIILFYLNMMAHISEMSGRTYIPLFHVTCMLMVIIPIASIVLYGANGTML